MSVSIFSSNEIVNPSVLHKMRYFHSYLLTSLCHTLPSKNISCPFVIPSVQKKSFNHLDMRPNSPSASIARPKLALILKYNNHTQKHSPCRKVAMFWCLVVHKKSIFARTWMTPIQMRFAISRL